MRVKDSILRKVAQSIVFVFVSILMVACNQDTENTINVKDGKIALTPSMFKFKEAPFNEDEDVATRSMSNRTQTKSVELGNGIEAQMSLEVDTSKDSPLGDKSNQPRTRADVPLSNGFYTIRAFQGGVLKGELKGNITGGVFTPAAGTKECMYLEPGTYDFICFNDKVSLNADGTLSVTQANVKNAYIGRLEGMYITGKRMDISFIMKHVGARVFLELHSFEAIRHPVTAALTSPNNNVPTSIKLDAKGHNPVATSTTTINKNMIANYWQSVDVRPSLTETWDNVGVDQKLDDEWYYCNRDTAYTWFLPGTPLRQLRLTLPSLTLYGKTVGSSTHLYSTDPTLSSFMIKENTTYKLKIRLVYTGFKYLFSDGTVGTLKANRTKTPIAFVVKENDGTPNSGMAIALKDVDLGSSWNPVTHEAEKNMSCTWSTVSLGSTYFSGTNAYLTTNITASSFNDENGYNWTWDATTNAYPDNNSFPKGMNQYSYPAFYYAANYDPGVSLTGSIANQKWYLPATSEWYAAINALTLGQSHNNSTGDRRGGDMNKILLSFALSGHINADGLLVGGKNEFPNYMQPGRYDLDSYWCSSFSCSNSNGCQPYFMQFDASRNTFTSSNFGAKYTGWYSIAPYQGVSYNFMTNADKCKSRVRSFIHF